jgi:hypothetical protein
MPGGEAQVGRPSRRPGPEESTALGPGPPGRAGRAGRSGAGLEIDALRLKSEAASSTLAVDDPSIRDGRFPEDAWPLSPR